MLNDCEILGLLRGHRSLPVLTARVEAGFPSPADDYSEQRLDLNEHLITHPAATFALRATGNSMTSEGIRDGDILIVDRSLEPRPGQIVIASLDGELVLKRLSRGGSRQDRDFEIWGVCKYVIHKL